MRCCKLGKILCDVDCVSVDNCVWTAVQICGLCLVDIFQYVFFRARTDYLSLFLNIFSMQWWLFVKSPMLVLLFRVY